VGDKKELYKVGDVAVRLGISIPHTYRLAKTGEIPCVRIGPKAVRFEEAAVDRFIREHRSGKGKAA
jgi:excisionase family DNA binding protein